MRQPLAHSHTCVVTLQVAFHTLGMSELGMCLRVVFERASNWVRHGLRPVFVVDGLSPAAKEETLQKRCEWERKEEGEEEEEGTRLVLPVQRCCMASNQFAVPPVAARVYEGACAPLLVLMQPWALLRCSAEDLTTALRCVCCIEATGLAVSGACACDRLARYRTQHGSGAPQPDRSRVEGGFPPGWFGMCCREATRLLEAMVRMGGCVLLRCWIRTHARTHTHTHTRTHTQINAHK